MNTLCARLKSKFSTVGHTQKHFDVGWVVGVCGRRTGLDSVNQQYS